MSHTIPHPRLLLLSLALGGFAIGITEFATMGLIPYIAAGREREQQQAWVGDGV